MRLDVQFFSSQLCIKMSVDTLALNSMFTKFVYIYIGFIWHAVVKAAHAWLDIYNIGNAQMFMFS